MRRVLPNLAAALSLMIGVGLCALWVRSERTLDWLERVRGPVVEHLQTAPGRVEYARIVGPDDGRTATFKRYVHRYGVREAGANGTTTTYQRPRRAWRWLGFAFQRSRYAADPARPGQLLPLRPNMPVGYTAVTVAVPMWPLVAPLVLVPARMAARRWRSRRRRAQGRCVHCGYDLRASPDRCPECGTIITVPDRAA
jgi:hypothetical protein